MTKARANHRRWIAWVWNRAVRDDHDWTTRAAGTRRGGGDHAGHGHQGHQGQPHATGDDRVAIAVAQAREALTELQWTLTPRRRPALLLVGHTVLDRMERTGQLRVPVPERDLVLDTGITDRKTIRACLRLLVGHTANDAASGLDTHDTVRRAGSRVVGVGVLHTDTYDPRRKDTTSFEFEILPDMTTPHTQGVRQIPPPSLHTPVPGTWATFPPTAHTLWRTLIRVPDTAALELAAAAGLTRSRTDTPTPSQLRSVTTLLTELARAGLVSCDSVGRWRVTTGSNLEEHAQRSAAAYTHLAEQIDTERRTFRSSPGSTWSSARAAAAKQQRAKEVAWWNGLSKGEQARRRAHYAAAFTRHSVAEQEQLKHDWAQRRVRAGIDEPQRHNTWLDSLNMDQVVTRTIQRAAWFAALPQPLQQAHAAAWRRHRETFNIPRGTPLATSRNEHAAAFPPAYAARDHQFLDAQHPGRNPLPGLETTAS